MIDLKSQTLEEMTATLKAMGEPAFRGKQVFTWLHKGVTSFDEMTNLSKSLRETLKKRCYITAPSVARKQVSKLDGTVKYLWQLLDGNCIETVVMQYHHGNTVCVSSQVGCRMGCAFCASTIAGKVRDLTPSEILDQVIFAQKDSGLPISNIVLMGIGEPLDNLDNVLRFLELVNHPDGLNIGMRHISLSTCGVIPGIDRLSDLELQLTLSVSLHAPDSETRSKIMPVNRAYDVEKLFDACHRYFKKTGRRISFEYAMIDGVNDHDWQADLIAKKLKGMPGHVNLIPLNDVAESPLKPSRRVAAFQKRLESHGIYTMGDLARFSIHGEDRLYEIFGVDAEILIDHAWGCEPCGIEQIKSYKPSTNSISEGQVLTCPYPNDKAKLIVREMAEILMFRLTEKKLVTESITLEVGYDRENVDKGGYRGLTQTDRYGRVIPKAAHGTVRFDVPTNLGSTLINESAKLFERITDPALTVRRITINANKVTPDDGIYQVDFFTDTKKLEKEKKLQQAMLGIKNKYGKNAVLKASSYEEGATMRQRNAQIGGHSAGGSDEKLQK